jgi:hypothetical protein
MLLKQSCPPWVRQTYTDSCWAAVLDAWLRMNDGPAGSDTQEQLVSRWSTRSGGGLDPNRLDEIALWYGLILQPTDPAKTISGASARHVMESALKMSCVFFSFLNPKNGFWHTVLVYRLRDDDVSFMEPDGTKPPYHVASTTWLTQKVKQARVMYNP